jgi:hypothetical protein
MSTHVPPPDNSRPELHPESNDGSWSALFDDDLFVDDDSIFGLDGHLTDLGVSVLADVQREGDTLVHDLTDGLSIDDITAAGSHTATCGECSGRIQSVGRWTQTIQRVTLNDAMTAAVAPGPESKTAPESKPESKPESNVVQLDTVRRKRFPRFLVPVAASLAAVALGGSVLLNGSIVNNRNTSAEIAAAPETSVAAASAFSTEKSDRTVAESADVAADTNAATNAEAAENTAAAAAAADTSAPDSESAGQLADTTVVAAASAERAKQLPAAAAPALATTVPLITADDKLDQAEPPATAKDFADGDQNRTKVTGESPSLVPAPVPAPAKGSTASTDIPKLAGTFATFADAAQRLRANPKVAVLSDTPPCRVAIDRLIAERNLDPDLARFARAQVGEQVLILAIVQDTTGSIQVVGADSACHPIVR